MAKRIKHKCRHCHRLYTPSPRARGRQHYCAKAACRKASKTASQKKWATSKKGWDYFNGPGNVQRVQKWRKEHPGYWRKGWKKRLQGELAGVGKSDVALQDMVATEKAASGGHFTGKCAQDGGALREMIFEEPLVGVGQSGCSNALAARVERAEYAISGVLSLLGCTLQDSIGSNMARVIQLGRDARAQVPAECRSGLEFGKGGGCDAQGGVAARAGEANP